MTSEVTSLSEPLLTLLALVGPLTSVDPLVLSEATRPSEQLLALLALVALVGPLTSVGPLMTSEVTRPSELLLALLALVGPLTRCVGPLVLSTVAGTGNHILAMSLLLQLCSCACVRVVPSEPLKRRY